MLRVPTRDTANRVPYVRNIKKMKGITMKKLFPFILCAFVALFLMASPIVFATDIDILDVKTTFKIGGVDKTKIVTATGTNTVLKLTTVSLVSGSVTVASGLGTPIGALFLPKLSSTGTTTATFDYTISGTNVILYAFDRTGATSTSGYDGTALIYGTP